MNDPESAAPVALVTGGTRGIGKAISLALAGQGYRVIANYRSDQAAAQALLEQAGAHLSRVTVRRADVSQPVEAERLVKDTLDRYGQVDLLVNNVGPWWAQDVISTSPDDWRAVLDGNLSSAFYCIHAVLPAMRSRRHGCIINIGAVNAEVFPSGYGYSPVFGLAKAAVALMVRSLAYSEGPYGIRVNAINPGLIETPDYAAIPPEKLAQLVESIPLRRLGQPEDVAEAVLYLAGEKARYVTGAILHVHGGLSGV